MPRTFLTKLGGLVLALTFLMPSLALAQEQAGFKSRCANIPDGFPQCADSPNECGSDKNTGNAPLNCIYLVEPIGGRPGYDLYKRDCIASPTDQGGSAKPICVYTLYYGEAIVGKTVGPFQAILVYEKGKESQGPFGLLYNYLGLIYNYMSGIIIGFVILVVVIGGVRITTSAGDTSKYEEGKKWIIGAILGMILWFTASVILYTINPTFFAF